MNCTDLFGCTLNATTRVLIRERHIEVLHIDRRGEVMEPLFLVSRNKRGKLRTATSWKRQGKLSLLEMPEEVCSAHLDVVPVIQASGLHSSNRGNIFCCYKPPSFWLFVIAVTGNIYIIYYVPFFFFNRTGS